MIETESYLSATVLPVPKFGNLFFPLIFSLRLKQFKMITWKAHFAPRNVVDILSDMKEFAVVLLCL